MTASLDLLAPIVRGLIAITLLLLIGLPVAGRLVARYGSIRGSAGHQTTTGWFERLPGLLAWFLLTCSLLRGALQLLAFTDPGEPITADLAHAVLLEGSWGMAWLVQSSAALLLLATSWLWRHHHRLLKASTALLIMVTVVAQTYLGHAMDELWPGALGHMVHAVHLLGSGIWLGSLAILALSTFPTLRAESDLPTLTALLRAFSRVARIGVGLVVLSGLAALWIYSGGAVLDLLDSAWGRLVAIKLLLVGATLGLGWWNWRFGTPALAIGSPGAPAKMRRAIAIELLAGVVILALTAWLIGTPLPSHTG